jgi:tellurite resistance protein TerC
MPSYLSFELIAMVVITLILVLDILLIFKRPHIPSAKESTLFIVFYAGLACLFGLLLWQLFSVERATEFFAGWLTEYSLSLDNLFVFVIIMQRAQQKDKMAEYKDIELGSEPCVTVPPTCRCVVVV